VNSLNLNLKRSAKQMRN